MKTKNLSLMLLLTLAMMFIATFLTQINVNALWNDDFNVSWSKAEDEDSSGSASITSTDSMDDSFSKIIDKYKTVITFVSAIGAVTMVAIFIINFMKLGSTSGNPTERSKCIAALIWSGLAAAGLGSVALIVGIFYGMLK